MIKTGQPTSWAIKQALVTSFRRSPRLKPVSNERVSMLRVYFTSLFWLRATLPLIDSIAASGDTPAASPAATTSAVATSEAADKALLEAFIV